MKLKGTLKKFDTQRGYGFITAEDGGDYFTHVTGLRFNPELLEDGMTLYFNVGWHKDKVIAIDVSRVKPKEELYYE